MEAGREEFFEVFSSINDKEDMKRFLSEILTDKELDTLFLRWDLMKEIESGLSQREIAKKYHLSLCKITRGSKILQRKGSICKREISKRSNQNGILK